MKKQKYFYLLLLLALAACNSGNKSAEESINDEVASSKKDSAAIVVSEKVIDDFIHSIPSPIELSSMIQSTGADYNSAYLNPTSNLEKYSGDFQKALNLGTYGVDLGYMYIYEKTLPSIDYILSIRNLATDLKVDQFFDFNALKKLSQSGKNIDSLIDMTTRSFLHMNSYLRDQKRARISVLIVTGTWVEGMYLATQIANKKANKELYDRVGEQKAVLDNLLLILDVYKNAPEFANLASKFQNLKKIFEGITISYTYGKPKAKEVNGELVIEDQSTSTVTISADQVKALAEEVSAIRNSIIN